MSTDPAATTTATPHPATGHPTTPHPATGYRMLRAWQRALDVAATTHALALTLPPADRDTLGADLRRAGSAVPTHIAAGNYAYARPEHHRALGAAASALARVETLALLAERLALLPASAVAALLIETGDTLRLVRALARAVSTPPATERPTNPAPVAKPPARATRAPRASRTSRASARETGDTPTHSAERMPNGMARNGASAPESPRSPHATRRRSPPHP